MTAARIASIIDRLGETVTLRRRGTPNVDVTVKASIRQYDAAATIGNVIQGRAEIRISNKEIAAAAWPGPVGRPQQHDQIIRDGKTLNVESVETRNWHEDTAIHILQVRG